MTQDKEVLIKKYENEILRNEKTILNLERKIEVEEKEIEKAAKGLYRLIGFFNFIGAGFSKTGGDFLRSGFIRRFSKHKLLYSLTIVTGVVLIWRGLWNIADFTPGISNPFISILLGIGIIWLVDSISELI